jgi:hypothetical protein
VVRGFYSHNVCHEVRAQQYTEALNGVLLFRFTATERDQSEMLIRTKHDQVRTELDTRDISSVIIHLDS